MKPCRHCGGTAIVVHAHATSSDVDVTITCCCEAETVIGPIEWARKEWNAIHSTMPKGDRVGRTVRATFAKETFERVFVSNTPK